MAHARKTIRDAVVVLLQAMPTYGSGVVANRIYDIASGDLPHVNVMDVEETAELISMGRTYERTLTLAIECRASAASSLDDTLDAMAAEVEAALDGTQPASVKEVTLANMKKEDIDGGSKPHGIMTLEFEIVYCTTGGDPTTIV